MREVNVSPLATNVLDLAGRQTLCTRDGRKVEVLRSMMGFVIQVEYEKPFSTNDNLAASRYLNSLPLYVREGA